MFLYIEKCTIGNDYRLAWEFESISTVDSNGDDETWMEVVWIEGKVRQDSVIKSVTLLFQIVNNVVIIIINILL